MSTESMVTQADRDAAADYWAGSVGVTEDFVLELRTGVYDDDKDSLPRAFARHRTAAQPEREAALEEAADAMPSTAENPNEDDYQRGRFDGIMEYQRAIRALKTTPAPAVSTDEAVAVLKPFAHEYRTAGADHLPDEMRWVDASGDVPSDPVICCALTVGDLRRAAAILARLGEGE